MLLVEQLETLILYGTFSEFFFNGIAISTIFYFRYKRPDAFRPIKVSYLLYQYIFKISLR
jgi:hypothetical protein